MTTSSGALLSSDGAFANGVRASAVVQLILDHDETARIEDVADYFQLTVDEVAAALDYCSPHFERLRRGGGWFGDRATHAPPTSGTACRPCPSRRKRAWRSG
jgi:hypothetical protein